MRALLLLLSVAALTLTSCLDSLTGTSDPEDDASAENREVARESSSSKKEASGAKKEEPEKKSLTQLRTEKKALEKRLEELEQLGATGAEMLAEEQATLDAMVKIQNYDKALDTLKEEIGASLGGWRAATRKSFAGVQLPEIATLSGERFETVTILEVHDDTVKIKHAGGEATLEISSLSPSLRKNLIHEQTITELRSTL